eukprot:m.480034 g.480034  ORF g.480034 m.480034 type:complete len:108 (+) comp51537_c0_seq1:1230-1553(+)
MAPEVLRGERIREDQAPALDVYSFAVVLWEIWTRGRPWDEIQVEGVAFSQALTERVTAGHQPAISPECGDAPHGYSELMEQCWVGVGRDRPTFSAILAALTAIDPKL